jgi:hypothetical protein
VENPEKPLGYAGFFFCSEKILKSINKGGMCRIFVNGGEAMRV